LIKHYVAKREGFISPRALPLHMVLPRISGAAEPFYSLFPKPLTLSP